MKQMPSVVATALLAVVWGRVLAAPAAFPTPVAYALATAVEASAATTRPWHWPMKRACLYYAFAGQALLAQAGIPAALRVGQVEYRPGTAAAYSIAPHAWLETEAYVIDYATLPRWGQVAVIPRNLVASDRSTVIPGVTQLLALPAEPNQSLGLYLSHHYRRFHALSTAARRNGLWQQPLLETDRFPRCKLTGISDHRP